MNVVETELKLTRDFVETHHYSHSINGVKISKCFGLYDEGELVGVCLFGPLSTTAWKRYATQEQDVVELRRLVCLDKCPRNTESWFISKCIKILKKTSSYKICISYADPRFGHCGYIYQASNWDYLGKTKPDTVYITPEGREYHSRALRTKYNGEYKPFVVKLRKLLEDEKLNKKEIPGKHIYAYYLNGVHKRYNLLKYPKLNEK